MNDYINLAMRTNSNVVGEHGRNSIDFVHACLGLVTELDELHKATDDVNYREEVGDMCWYIALACHAVNVEWPEPFEPSVDMSLDDLVFALADWSKKWFAYGKRPSTAVVEIYLAAIVAKLGDIDDAQQRNIAKLSARYPERFDSGQAIHRDLDAEARALGNDDA